MAICITRWEMMKTESGEYKFSKYKSVVKFPNDYFDNKLDIFNESDWKDFLINYKGTGLGRITKYSEENILLCWSITAVGSSAIVRQYFANPKQAVCHLFPLTASLKNEGVKKLLLYNQKYIWPNIPKR